MICSAKDDVTTFVLCRRGSFLHQSHTRWNTAAGERRGDDWLACCAEVCNSLQPIIPSHLAVLGNAAACVCQEAFGRSLINHVRFAAYCRECGLPSAAQQAAAEAEQDRDSLLGRTAGAPPPLPPAAGIGSTMAAAGAARTQLRQNMEHLNDMADKTSEVRTTKACCKLLCHLQFGLLLILSGNVVARCATMRRHLLRWPRRRARSRTGLVAVSLAFKTMLHQIAAFIRDI